MTLALEHGMTIYIHFADKTRAIPVIKVCNVASVLDNGPFAVRVTMQFTDARPRFESVSHVALQPEKE